MIFNYTAGGLFCILRRMSYIHSVRVYYEDTDFGGRVYYANYLKFAERARTELLRARGIEQTELLKSHGIGFVVRKCSIEFFKPAMMDDLLTIETLVDDITKATITMQQTIKKNTETLAQLEVRLAVISKDNGRVVRLPDTIYTALTT
jgi:acyl-CoA thioester hydrolase